MRTGLVRSVPLGVGKRRIAYVITAAGIQAAGSELKAPSRPISPATEVHDWCVTTLTALCGADGVSTLTVREMVLAQQMDQLRLPSNSDSSGRRRVHYPDLLVRSPAGRFIAIEIERTAKSSHRLRQILTRYQSCPDVDRVIYLGGRGVRTKVERVATQLGLADAVQTSGLPEPEIEAWRAAFPDIAEPIAVRSDEASANRPVERPNPVTSPEGPSAPATPVGHRVLADQIVAAPTSQPAPARARPARDRTLDGPPQVVRERDY